MSGVRRCKDFLLNLSEEEQRKIRVKIKRPGIKEPDVALPLYRGLDDPKSLVIHFKKEALRGIFDREDIVLNQEFPQEKLKKDSREYRRRSSSTEDTFHRREEKSRDVSYCQKSPSGSREDRGRFYRSRSRSSDRYRRDRSRSSSVRRRGRSKSPLRREYSRRPQSGERKRSRSLSPVPQSKKKPGLFIPTHSDYLRYKRKRTERSRSPVSKYSSTKVGESSSRSERDKYRSPRKRSRTPRRKRSRTPLRDGRSTTPRGERSVTPPRSRRSRTSSRGRRSRSTSRGRRSRTRSPAPRRSRRSRSASRHCVREIEEIGHYGNPHMAPYIFQDGKYWIPVGPSFLPRGFIPPAQYLYPRPFPPPMMMRTNMIQPLRPKLYRPRSQNYVSDVATTSRVQISEVPGNEESNKSQDNSKTE